MAEDPKPKGVLLREVVIKGNKPAPKRYKAAMARLAPGHGEIEQSKLDSLVKAGRGDLIGKPSHKPGQMPYYGPEATDIIKKLVKSK